MFKGKEGIRINFGVRIRVKFETLEMVSESGSGSAKMANIRVCTQS
jgi:hypothetical protein